MCRSEMNDTSMVTMSNAGTSGSWSGVSVRAFSALDDDHAGIVAQLQSSCPWPTSRATTRARAALQQDVGESAGGRADVEGRRGRRR